MDKIKFYITVGTRATEIVKRNRTGFAGSAAFAPSGWELVEATMAYLKTEKQFLVSRLTADLAIRSVGSALPTEQNLVTELTGRDMNSGLPARLEVSTQNVQEAIARILDLIIHKIVRRISYTTSTLPPETVVDPKIILTGDFRTLRGLDQRLEEAIRATAIPDATVIIENG